MIDPELVTRKLAFIAGDLNELRAIAAKSPDQYLASLRDQLAAERLLERMISRMIDINYHLIIETGHPPPADYYESFIRPDYLRAVQQYVEKTFPDSPR